jgi:hypothetical protein
MLDRPVEPGDDEGESHDAVMTGCQSLGCLTFK